MRYLAKHSSKQIPYIFDTIQVQKEEGWDGLYFLQLVDKLDQNKHPKMEARRDRLGHMGHMELPCSSNHNQRRDFVH